MTSCDDDDSHRRAGEEGCMGTILPLHSNTLSHGPVCSWSLIVQFLSFRYSTLLLTLLPPLPFSTLLSPFNLLLTLVVLFSALFFSFPIFLLFSSLLISSHLFPSLLFPSLLFSSLLLSSPLQSSPLPFPSLPFSLLLMSSVSFLAL